LRRPLLRLASPGYAAASGIPGLLTAPFGCASRLRAAGNGIWYRLPELAFFNSLEGS
jgi:hypothetical protein